MYKINCFGLENNYTHLIHARLCLGQGIHKNGWMAVCSLEEMESVLISTGFILEMFSIVMDVKEWCIQAIFRLRLMKTTLLVHGQRQF